MGILKNHTTISDRDKLKRLIKDTQSDKSITAQKNK